MALMANLIAGAMPSIIVFISFFVPETLNSSIRTAQFVIGRTIYPDEKQHSLFGHGNFFGLVDHPFSKK